MRTITKYVEVEVDVDLDDDDIAEFLKSEIGRTTNMRAAA